MRVHMRYLSITVIVLTLFGCATGPKYAEVAGSIAKVANGQARIYFYRASPFGGAYQPDVSANQIRVGNAVPNGVFYRDFTPGNYLIMTTMDQGTQISLRTGFKNGFRHFAGSASRSGSSRF